MQYTLHNTRNKLANIFELNKQLAFKIRGKKCRCLCGYIVQHTQIVKHENSEVHIKRIKKTISDKSQYERIKMLYNLYTNYEAEQIETLLKDPDELIKRHNNLYEFAKTRTGSIDRKVITDYLEKSSDETRKLTAGGHRPKHKQTRYKINYYSRVQ